MEEPTASWAPWNFQLATMVPAAGWAPGLFPAETESADEMFGSGRHQTSVPSSSSGGHQQHYDPTIENNAVQELFDDVDFHSMSMEMKRINQNNNPMRVFEVAAREFKVDIDTMKMKIHRYPTSIREFKQFEQWFTAPRLVAIGPYHHGRNHQLTHAEKAKHVAAYHCIMESGHPVQEVYDAVVSAAHEARSLSLYAKDAMAVIGDGDFLPMMFYDACFLVQYMAWYMNTGGSGDDETAVMDPSLRGFFDFNRKAILHDIMLLENQIPWRVVAAVLLFRPVDLASFVAQWKDYLQDRKHLVLQEKKPFVLDDGYEPPHLLGLLRFYIVGRSSAKRPTKPKIMSSISESVSAIELAEIGIELRANRAATEIIHMGVTYRRGTAALFAELSLPPLSLDDERASFLVNMAALELCTTSNFQEAEDEESAICSYLLLLAMLVDREEDVHELRKRRLLQGGGGLTNKEALEFLTGLQSLPLRGSSCYIRVMEEIEKYRINRPLQIMVHAFIYKHRTAIFTVFSVIGVLVSILGTLLSLKARSVIK
ncbi:hypothetical protein BS78_05G265700 [Paspalum vaginatum]|nr:hypothetical protein BS78_05G265700 [Paspalum vaginatum]KAJ1277069.1 hypothetical protein BS78_05G265700 [Paspalum vaginatum]